MDFRHRVYYLVHLNQNYRKNGWWSKDWDDYGMRYDYNLMMLKRKIKSLKLIPVDSYDVHYHMKISCKKEEEKVLIDLLNSLKDVDYQKIGG